MTVGELINVLSAFPPDLPVVLSADEDCDCFRIEALGINRIDMDEPRWRLARGACDVGDLLRIAFS